MQDTIFWAGPQSSYEAFKALQPPTAEQAMAVMKADEALEAQQGHWALENQNGVGVITVSGSLIDGSAGYYRYYGYIGYDDIRNAAMTALADPAIGAMLLVMKTPGGMVAGVNETSKALATLSKIKPIITFNASQMTSAGLWLGSAGKKIVTDATALNGSLGIMQIHTEYSKLYEKEGITKTVIRAGENKVLANAVEPLSDKAKAQMEAQAKTMYNVFLSTVASNMGHTEALAESKYGGGKVFIGQEAVDVGLAHTVGGYDDAYALAKKAADKIVAKAAPQTPNPQRTVVYRADLGATNMVAVPMLGLTSDGFVADNSAITEGTPTMTRPLDPEALAALAGVSPEAAAAAAAALTEPDAAAAAAAAAQPTASAPTAPVTTPVTTPAPASASEDVAALTANLATTKNLLTETTANLTAANAQVETLKTELANANAKAQASEAAMAPFVEVVRKNLTAMGINFGLNAEAVAKLAPSEVLSEHKRVSDLFVAKLKAGPVAQSSKPEVAKAELPLAFALRTNQLK